MQRNFLACLLILFCAVVMPDSAAQAAAAEGTPMPAPDEKPFTVVIVNLETRTLDRALPFDVPFLLQSSIYDTVSEVHATYIEFTSQADLELFNEFTAFKNQSPEDQFKAFSNRTDLEQFAEFKGKLPLMVVRT